MTTIPRNFKKCDQNFFEIGLSGVRLYIVGSLVDFVFVCWCLQVPTHYALSATANGRQSLRGVRQTNKHQAVLSSVFYSR